MYIPIQQRSLFHLYLLWFPSWDGTEQISEPLQNLLPRDRLAHVLEVGVEARIFDTTVLSQEHAVFHGTELIEHSLQECQ